MADNKILLDIKGLHADVGDKEILRGIDLTIREGETHAIMGPNGSGKSTLSAVLAGRDNYTVTSGEVTFNGHNLLSFQYPIEIPGVTNVNFMRTAVNEHRRHRGLEPLNAADFLKLMRSRMEIVEMNPSFSSRGVNVGFSGGEKKRNEIFQMAMLEPRLSILDETDSGLDVSGHRRQQTPQAGQCSHRHHPLPETVGLYRTRCGTRALQGPHHQDRRQGARQGDRGKRLRLDHQRLGDGHMADNYIYAPVHNIEGGFRCRVPLKGSRQIFMIDGGVQGTGRPLDIRFEKGKLYEEALQVISIRTEKHPEDVSMKSRFHFEEGSSAKLILCSHTFADDPFRTDEKVDITVENGACADIVIMQNEHNRATHNTVYDIHLAEGASLKAVILTIHGGMIDNRMNISLDGPHADCDISGLYLVDGSQKVSNSLNVLHKVPECHSRELFKGILDNSATAYFSGLIHVFPDAQKTEAYQECHNLLLNRDARAFAQPQLEIYADDVKCSHGATNGRMNEDELFYMRSRGIPLKEAKVLQQLAFAYAVLDKISSQELKERMASLTERRLRGEFSDCNSCCRNCC